VLKNWYNVCKCTSLTPNHGQNGDGFSSTPVAFDLRCKYHKNNWLVSTKENQRPESGIIYKYPAVCNHNFQRNLEKSETGWLATQKKEALGHKRAGTKEINGQKGCVSRNPRVSSRRRSLPNIENCDNRRVKF